MPWAVIASERFASGSASSSSVSTFDVINLFSAAFSIVLAAVALFLSLYFYRRSVEQARLAETSASQIAASVDRLEKLFSSLYADTFSMMRDTVSDMRAHIWSRGETDSVDTNSVLAQAELAATSRIEEARRDLMSQISLSAQQSGVAENTLGDILTELTPAIDKALGESSEAGAERTAKMAFVLSTLKSYLSSPKLIHQRQAFADIVQEMQKFGFASEDIEQTLLQARDEGWVSWAGQSKSLAANTLVSFRRT